LVSTKRLAVISLGDLNPIGCLDVADGFDKLFIVNSSILNFWHKKTTSEDMV
jgi:hypothetical protein